jgi:ribosomal protein S18 acetylase RimI-like enzyme
MVNIAYIETDGKDIDLVRPLWEQLREHHRARSTNFAPHYEATTFDHRKSDLLYKTKDGLMHIDFAKDMASGRYVGYCISSIVMDHDEKVGEIDSIFVDKTYRLEGIGDTLIKKALGWMDLQCVDVKKVSVGSGNEEVFPFYARYGFYPRMTTLEQVKK